MKKARVFTFEQLSRFCRDNSYDYSRGVESILFMIYDGPSTIIAGFLDVGNSPSRFVGLKDVNLVCKSIEHEGLGFTVNLEVKR